MDIERFRDVEPFAQLREIAFKKSQTFGVQRNVANCFVRLSDTGIVRHMIIRDALSRRDTLCILMRTVSEKSAATLPKAPVISKEMISLKRRITSLPVTRSSRRREI